MNIKKFVQRCDIEHKQLILMGDINSDYAETLDVHTRTLHFISSVYQLEQLIKEPTRVTKSSATSIINDLSRVSWQNVECFDDPSLESMEV